MTTGIVPDMRRSFDPERYIRGLQRRQARGPQCGRCGGPLVSGEGQTVCPVCGLTVGREGAGR